MLIFVRHGKTESNEPGDKKLRGWLPIPLDLNGMREAEETAQSLSDVKKIAHLYCGTLVRVIQSAQEVAKVFGKPLEPGEEWNTWNTGDHAGGKVSEEEKELQHHVANPTEDVPGGEPFQFFLDRIVPKLKQAVESKDVNILVSSGRVSVVIEALSKTKGKYPSTDVMLKGESSIDPSGVMVVDRNWRILFKTTKLEKGQGLS